jgi:hypothetical protein
VLDIDAVETAARIMQSALQGSHFILKRFDALRL